MVSPVRLGEAINDNVNNDNFIASTALIPFSPQGAEETDFYGVEFENLLSKITTLTFANLGLKILDSNASNYLTLTTESDLTSDRILSFNTGDAARTITLSGNPTLGDWFNQGVKTTDSPSFVEITATTINTDSIQEVTGSNGVNIDGIKLKDNTITPTSGTTLDLNGATVGAGEVAQTAILKYFIDNYLVADEYTIQGSDNAALIYHSFSENSTITFPGDPAFPGRTLPDGFFIIIENRNSGANTLTINTTEDLNIYSGIGDGGASTSIVLHPGEAVQIVKTGWQIASALTPPNGKSSGKSTFKNGELAILDNDEAHKINFFIDADLTEDRTLSFLTQDANRVITLSGNPTLGDWFDQSVKSTDIVNFFGLNTSSIHPTNPATERVSIYKLALLNADFSHKLLINYVDNPMQAARVLDLSTNNENVQLTVSGNSTINQDVSTSGTPSFNSITLATTGGTPAALNYYEENYTSTSNTWTGIWASPIAMNYTITRIGNMVFFDSGTANILATANTAGTITNTEALPARFRPSVGYNKPTIMISNGGSVEVGRLDIGTNGILTIQRTPSGSIDGTGSGGAFHFNAFWKV